jgi:hypothetical protein
MGGVAGGGAIVSRRDDGYWSHAGVRGAHAPIVVHMVWLSTMRALPVAVCGGLV